MSDTKKLVFAATMVALGITLPIAFHIVPQGGAIFAPMHLPIMIAGFICGPYYGAMVGLICPIMSFVFTGMPSIVILPNMMTETFCYGMLTGLLFGFVHTKYFMLDVYISLVLAMLIGRIAGGAVVYMMYIGNMRGAYSFSAFFTTYFVLCLPAIGIQLTLVPSVALTARRTHFIRERERCIGSHRAEPNCG